VRYALYIEDIDNGGLTEVIVDKKTWEMYKIGDRYKPTK
jgi:hypothetical protein